MSADGLSRANAARAEARAKGESVEILNPIERARRNPRSKVKALRAYFWDLELVLLNRGTPEGGEQRRIADARYRDARAESRRTSLPGVIKALCLACVSGKDDPAPKLQVRNCRCAGCPLHPVRPYRRAAKPGRRLAGGEEPAQEGVAKVS